MSRHCLSFALLAILAWLACAPTAQAQLTAAEINTLVTRHNYYRNNAQLTVKANPALPQMVWDAGLQANAQAYLNACPSGHSSSASRSNVRSNCTAVAGQKFGYVGENLAWGSSLDAQRTVDMWSGEQPKYNLTANTCSGVCGHWTQVTWRSSVYLGCAKKRCGSSTYFLCQYGPGGNYIGQRPYTACTSNCPTGAGAVTQCNVAAKGTTRQTSSTEENSLRANLLRGVEKASESSVCGNGIVEADEQCDVGLVQVADCSSFGNSYTGTATCSGECQWDTSSCLLSDD